ncbi:hypothetical protein KS4_09730 [Poriferisphaera corsica]|uniref:Uncharacterized protein n=1 Tax=Poriferisphaera corsica TaxID=2528020 RepID=A0A517YRT6_9BACT|nr:hypothetical protein [Poriferisphaera corsica]QDU32934.1 hypothetical protein KS4_09730 [Poriferisphaera corsica]
MGAESAHHGSCVLPTLLGAPAPSSVWMEHAVPEGSLRFADLLIDCSDVIVKYAASEKEVTGVV